MFVLVEETKGHNLKEVMCLVYYWVPDGTAIYRDVLTNTTG